MRVTVLMDDLPGEREGLRCEHGLSCYVQTDAGNVLFDCGATDAFISNAEALGIDLAQTQAVVLSHSHYDHAGGFPAFAARYPGCECLYTGTGFFEPKYSRAGENLLDRSCGFGRSLLEKQGIRHREVANLEELLPGVYLVSGFPRVTAYEKIPERFLRLREGTLLADDFSDEVCLVLETRSGLVVLAGCSHPGIINMLASVKTVFGKPIRAVFGGVHLIDADEIRIQKTVEALRSLQVQQLGLSHCTGQVAQERIARTPAFSCRQLRCGHSVEFCDGGSF